jgi:hypothetical protein
MGMPIFTIGYRDGLNVKSPPCDKHRDHPYYRAGFAAGATSPKRLQRPLFDGHPPTRLIRDERHHYFKQIWSEALMARRKEREEALMVVYNDPKRLIIQSNMVGSRWLATVVNPKTGKKKTHDLPLSYIPEMMKKLEQSPFWLLDT